MPPSPHGSHRPLIPTIVAPQPINRPLLNLTPPPTGNKSSTTSAQVVPALSVAIAPDPVLPPLGHPLGPMTCLLWSSSPIASSGSLCRRDPPILANCGCLQRWHLPAPASSPPSSGCTPFFPNCLLAKYASDSKSPSSGCTPFFPYWLLANSHGHVDATTCQHGRF
nr:unnamed protein product [Digitaria exilis]